MKDRLDHEIHARTAAIATLQDEIKVLQSALTLCNGDPRGTTPAPARRKPIAEHRRIKVGKAKDNNTRKAPTPIPTGRVSTPLDGDKPTTIAGAMKMFIRATPNFTGEGLRQKLEMDEDYAKLLAESSAGVVQGSLSYWTRQGYLARDGELPLESTYTVTAAGKEWFGS